MEQCLDDYKIFYRCVWHRDSGSQVMKVEGHKFSTDFAPPDNGWSSTAFMALTDLTVLLTKFGKEIPVRKGQIVVVPAQFPYDFQVKPSPSGLAYFLLKHLFPA